MSVDPPTGVDRPPLVYRVRPNSREGVPPIVMLHGLGGDERAIWELISALPAGGLVAAPRAPYLQPAGGYGWLPQLGAWPPRLEEFSASLQVFDRFLRYLQAAHRVDPDRLMLLGFSQGAAMAFAAAMARPAPQLRPAGLVAGAGHLPEGDLSPLRGLPIFWAHGRRDPLIPVSVARTDVERLRQVGARVHYCETDTAHKVGVDCLKELKAWIPAQFRDPLKEASRG